MKTYQCIVCGFIYDEAKGMPEDGIPAYFSNNDRPFQIQRDRQSSSI